LHISSDLPGSTYNSKAVFSGICSLLENQSRRKRRHLKMMHWTRGKYLAMVSHPDSFITSVTEIELTNKLGLSLAQIDNRTILIGLAQII